MYNQLQPTSFKPLSQTQINPFATLDHSKLKGSTITSVNTRFQDGILSTTLAPLSISHQSVSRYRYEAIALNKPFLPEIPQAHSPYEALLETSTLQQKSEQICVKLSLYTSPLLDSANANRTTLEPINANQALASNLVPSELFAPLSPLMQQQIPAIPEPNALAIVPYVPPTTWVIPATLVTPATKNTELQPALELDATDDIQDDHTSELMRYPPIVRRHVENIIEIENALEANQDKGVILAELSIARGNIEIENISIRNALELLEITNASPKSILRNLSEDDVKDIKTVNSLNELIEISEALDSLSDFCRTLYSRIENQIQEKVTVSTFKFTTTPFKEIRVKFEQELAKLREAKAQLEAKKKQYLAAGIDTTELLEEKIMLSRQISQTLRTIDLERLNTGNKDAQLVYKQIIKSLHRLFGELFFMLPKPHVYVPEANLWRNIKTGGKPQIRQQRLRFEGSLSIDLSQNDRVYPERHQSSEAQTPYKFLGYSSKASQSSLASTALSAEKKARKVCFKMEVSEILVDKFETEMAMDDEPPLTSMETASSSLRFENIDDEDEWEDIDDDEDQWEDIDDMTSFMK